MSGRLCWMLVAGLALTAGCSKKEAPLTPEEARAKGNALIKKMSDTVAGTKAFSYSTDEVRERVRRSGEKVSSKFTRKVVVRRPDAFMFTTSGGDRDGAAWYDGKYITAISNKQKIWVRGPMPPTLDEAIDFVSAEYAVQMPSGDLLYSNPYEALISSATTGGWVNTEQVGTRTCDHLSYQEGDIAWQLWLTQDDKALPCKIEITYKGEKGQPKAEVVFSDWNSNPTITDSTFVPAVPDGYSRIKMLRHATVEAPAAGAPTPTAAPAGAQPR
jgi:hypothetical protein